MRWDVFCRVIDNYGDVGVAWRLAADLGARGESVRLWIDDPSALAWMAPAGAPGVEVVAWREPLRDAAPGDVVVEMFGCDPPAAFVARMRDVRPVWINLEYLSAEPYVERSHGLPSPRDGLIKWFYYPGFTPATGGLLREPGLAGAREQFDRDAWLAERGWARTGERVVTCFAYPQAPFDALLAALDKEPTLLLACAGASQAPCLAAVAERRQVRAVALPWLTQPDYDRLLWSADLNLARGEDSIVRALWAGAPCVWHIYPQRDGVHAGKLDALLDRLGAAPDVRALWRAWNGFDRWPAAWPDPMAWRTSARDARDALLRQPDLVTQLLGFVAAKR